MLKEKNNDIWWTYSKRQGNSLWQNCSNLFQKWTNIQNLFSDVWLLNEVPEEYVIPKKDTGVDLVARNEATGELTAIQAKFYDNKIYKRHIDSFLAELGKSYGDNWLMFKWLQ